MPMAKVVTAIVLLLGGAEASLKDERLFPMTELEHPAKHPLLKTVFDPKREQSKVIEAKKRRLDACEDDPLWHKSGETDKDCDWAGQWSPRCDAKGLDGTMASDACPKSCDVCEEYTCPYSDLSVDSERGMIFDQLSQEEIDASFDGLNASMGGTLSKKELIEDAYGALMTNFVINYQLFPPEKTAAIAYLDGLTDTAPDRYTFLTVHRGAYDPKDVMEYKIGPLVDGALVDGYTIEELFEADEATWETRQQVRTEGSCCGLRDAIDNAMADLMPLLVASTGPAFPCGDNITAFEVGDAESTAALLEDDDEAQTCSFSYWRGGTYDPDGRRAVTAYFWLNPRPAMYTLIPVPLSITMYSGEDPEETANWPIVIQYCYNGPYNSTADLLADWENGVFETCEMGLDDYRWTNTRWVEQGLVKEREADGVGMTYSSSYEPSGSRFAVDGSAYGWTASWMGWEFHFGVEEVHGLSLHNIKFNGERIAYELSFQEYVASYSGYGSTGQVLYHDGTYMIGSEGSPLLAGVDCPLSATYLPVALHHYGGDHVTIDEDYLCIFEDPQNEGLWRHWDWHADGKSSGIPKADLTVRYISTMGNYDYIATVKFGLAGAIHTTLEFGGYMVNSFAFADHDKNPETPLFGSRVEQHSNGMLHDHMVSIKLDLDVNGTANTLVTKKIKYGTYEEAYASAGMEMPDPGWHTIHSPGVKYAEITTHEMEVGLKESTFDYALVESTTKNKWGEPRSYRILFDATDDGTVYPDDHPIVLGASWMKYNLAATAYNQYEKFVGYPTNNQFDHPVKSYDLDYFLNNESIVEEDLVFYVHIGKQHFPIAEDVPLVSNFGGGFWLMPFNYFDAAAFVDLPDADLDYTPECIPQATEGTVLYPEFEQSSS